MAVYKADLDDFNFNLLDYLKASEHKPDFGEVEIKEILSEFNKFAENEMYPSRQNADEEGVELKDGKVTVPKAFQKTMRSLHENGWYGLGFKEEIGGIPTPEALTHSCFSLANASNVSFILYVQLSRGVVNVINAVATEDMKSKYVPLMMSGAAGGTMCLTEAGAGSDVGALTSTAVKQDNGEYKINGIKQFITGGDNDLYENIFHLVLARTPGAAVGTKGISLFMVPKFRLNSDGSNGEFNHVTCQKVEEKMGIHGSATCELNFGGDGECLGELVGAEGDGMKNMFIMMNEVRLACGVQGESQANLAYELTKQFVNERVQFRTEIVNHPDVKRMLLKVRAISRGMRALNLFTANEFDLAHSNPGAGHEDLIALLTPICKAYCTDEGFNAAVDCIQLHGGYGFCSEYGIEQFARDLKIASIYEGTNAIQANDYVGRKILKDNGQTITKLLDRIEASVKSADDFKEENVLITESIAQTKEVLALYASLAKDKKMNHVLESATDFLRFSGNLVISWILLEQARLANSKIQSAKDDNERSFLESKIIDYKVFTRNYLTRNKGLASTLLDYDHEIHQFPVH